ncbi:unnamed protein product [Cuscuta epithymum]|uniref:Integrase catalytic domain-containing protein n=1 Tax=Cuscuta epithymum TaxID=186058 RepID=A0AAV0EVI7_9ASTE|nr:unnamed protein product [Cuscuta epithymum]
MNPLNPIEDPTSPYYLHPGDHSGNRIIYETFTGDNFSAWKKSVVMSFTVKNKLGFLDGSIEQPSSDDQLRNSSWYRINALLLSWLMYSISPEIRSTFLYFTNAKDLWDEIKLRYDKSDGPRVFHLEKTLTNISQGTQTITAYYNLFKTLWDEYLNYRLIPTCKCGLCTCKINEVYQKLLDRDSVMKFLIGLNESYYNLRGQILQPNLTLSSVYSSFLQEESQRSLQNPIGSIPSFNETSASHIPTHDSTAFLAKFHSSKKKSNVTCTHCGYQGHSAEKCFQIIGYPNNWKGAKGQRFAPGFKSFQPSTKTPQAHLANASEESVSNDFDFCDPDLYNKFLQFMHTQQTKTSSANVSSANVASANVAMTINDAGDTSLNNNSEFIGKHFSFNALKKSIIWILDTGASDHMISDFCLYTSNTKSISINIQLPTGNFIQATHIGDITLNDNLTLHNVLYVPNFSFNLISVSSLALHENISVHFSSNHAALQDHLTNKIIGFAEIQNGLYHYNPATSSFTNHHNPAIKSVANSANTHYESPDLWHYRLGHFPYTKFKMLSDCIVDNNGTSTAPCDICHFAKQKRLPFNNSDSYANSAFDLIHMDVWGPYRVTSYSGFKYFLTIVDDHTRCTWVFMLKTKSEVKFHMINFHKMIETQFHKRIKCIRTDNGTEFIFPEFYKRNGIVHQLSCVETPQQNARVERKHQHILQIARALLYQSCLPLIFWADCVMTAVHIINRLPTVILKNKSPFELLYGIKPDYSHLKVFGSLAYASTLCANRTKFDQRAIKCVFIGYPLGSKGYKLYDLSNHKILISRNVKFYEMTFPYKNTTTDSLTKMNDISPTQDNIDLHIFDSYPKQLNTQSTSENHYEHVENQIHDEAAVFSHHDSSSLIQDNTNATMDEQHVQRQSTRVRSVPIHLKDYVYQLPISLDHNTNTNASVCNLVRYPINNYITYDRLTSSHKCFTVALSNTIEPKTYKQAIKFPEWKKAMNDEIQALENNKT